MVDMALAAAGAAVASAGTRVSIHTKYGGTL